MRVQTLISTMNLKDHQQLLEDMQIASPSVVINQVTKSQSRIINSTTTPNKIFSFNEKGLSRSRNKALALSSSEICIIADDDLKYTSNYIKTITEAFDKYPQADIIAFRVDSDFRRSSKKILQPGRVSFISSMKLSSVQIAFRRESIEKKKIRFNERFGAGAELYMGEENIFLADCIRSGLKIYSYPKKIADLQQSESTWFQGHNKKFFEIKGRVFYQISSVLTPLNIIQFALRKRQLYNKEIGMMHAIYYMMYGAWLEITSHEK